MDYRVLSRHGVREGGRDRDSERKRENEVNKSQRTKISSLLFLIICGSLFFRGLKRENLWPTDLHISFAVIFPVGHYKFSLAGVWRKHMSCLFRSRVRFLGPSNQYRCCAGFCGFLVQGRWSILGLNLLSAIPWLQVRHANPSVILTYRHHHHHHILTSVGKYGVFSWMRVHMYTRIYFELKHKKRERKKNPTN